MPTQMGINLNVLECALVQLSLLIHDRSQAILKGLILVLGPVTHPNAFCLLVSGQQGGVFEGSVLFTAAASLVTDLPSGSLTEVS